MPDMKPAEVYTYSNEYTQKPSLTVILENCDCRTCTGANPGMHAMFLFCDGSVGRTVYLPKDAAEALQRTLKALGARLEPSTAEAPDTVIDAQSVALLANQPTVRDAS